MKIKNLRKLTDTEKQSVLKVLNRRYGTSKLPKSRVMFTFDRTTNVTTCALLNEENGALTIGVSKRNPKDKYIAEIGEAIALSRAVRGGELCLR